MNNKGFCVRFKRGHHGVYTGYIGLDVLSWGILCYAGLEECEWSMLSEALAELPHHL